ncbi:Glutamate 5-kinase [Pseudobythopirellula maris]|uniref:Glutamate 5-kinase n=1 Tax=Pseudobythopirellula maris TaxID=2527991 RepID=A0A5C5ZJB6_9BACT|nr:glutamate 5-kinase [Pseudobythopirellula maris]TWT87346.1 Glutamate 5-kinase [Pseudobythopirellula maris]
MTDLLRKSILDAADTVVVKIGTRSLTAPNGALDEAQVVSVADQVAAVVESGRRVVLVSSGAVGAGIARLGLTSRPTDLAQLQAVAAVGQSHMMEAYNRTLEVHGLHAAQVLLTAADLNHRRRYLNIRNTLASLFEWGAVPIINENDTVRTYELRQTFGDNDRLAALVTNLIRAPLLVLLTDVEGLYDGDPASESSRVIPTVERIDDATMSFAGGTAANAGLRLSTGGMGSKLEAARIATEAGEHVVLANGRRPGVLMDLLAGEPVGTLFLAEGESVSSRKRWIGWTVQPAGTLTLDAGAVRAVVSGGSSLLAVGVKRLTGDFKLGDIVALSDESGVEVARGLTNYSADDLRMIAGQPSESFAGILGRCPYSEVIHRNNLVLIGKARTGC